MSKTKTKLTSRQGSLLLEAMRRYVQFHSGEELTKAWTGLGYYTKYKPVLDTGLMEWVYDQPPPRCMGWLRLTEAGAKIVEVWLHYQTWLDEEATDEL